MGVRVVQRGVAPRRQMLKEFVKMISIFIRKRTVLFERKNTLFRCILASPEITRDNTTTAKATAATTTAATKSATTTITKRITQNAENASLAY